jgi:hypothetical protein
VAIMVPVLLFFCVLWWWVVVKESVGESAIALMALTVVVALSRIQKTSTYVGCRILYE